MVGLAPLNCTKDVEDFGRLEYLSAFFIVGLNIFVDVEISVCFYHDLHNYCILSSSFDCKIELKFCS